MSKKVTKDIANEEENLEEKVVKKATKSTKKTTTSKKGTTTTAKKASAKTKKEGKASSAKVSKKEKLEKDDIKIEAVLEEKPKKRGRPKKVETEQVVELKEEKEPKKTAKKSAVKKSEIAESKEKETSKKAKTTSTTKVTKSKTTTKSKTASTTKKKSTTSAKKVARKTTKKSSSTKKSSKNKRTIRFVKTLNLANQYLKKNIAILEYFDLPYRYNETTVKVLAQTPKILFVYWDISDHDREQYILNYGENFFNETYPVLLVKNETLGYVEEIPINDFANSWYIHISDSRSKYSVELGRKYKNMPKFESPYIYIKDSNEIIAPNDHVLLNEIKPQIKYKNVKTNEVIFKNISNVIKDGKILDFYSLYQVIYNVEDINEFFTLDNPSSGNPTSTFK